MATTMRLAVAQSTVPDDPHDADAVSGAGRQIRALLRRAAGEGARLVQFPEGSIVYPSKTVMSSAGPDVVAAADWSRVDWSLLRGEAEAIAALAAELRVWVAFGGVHRLTSPHRPYNSCYLVSDTGGLVARYDKRLLSSTELTHLYTPGRDPVVVPVDGVRFGVALCIEAAFPELFAEYERLGADVVLLSTDGVDPMRAEIARSYAALYDLWIGYSVAAQHAAPAPAGIAAPGGRWLARCVPEDRPDVVIAELDLDATDPDIAIALQHARPWRRRVRAGIHEAGRITGDPLDALDSGF